MLFFKKKNQTEEILSKGNSGELYLKRIINFRDAISNVIKKISNTLEKKYGIKDLTNKGKEKAKFLSAVASSLAGTASKAAREKLEKGAKGRKLLSVADRFLPDKNAPPSKRKQKLLDLKNKLTKKAKGIGKTSLEKGIQASKFAGIKSVMGVGYIADLLKERSQRQAQEQENEQLNEQTDQSSKAYGIGRKFGSKVRTFRDSLSDKVQGLNSRYYESLDKLKERQDKRAREVEEEKAAVLARLPKKKEQSGTDWLSKITGAISGVGSMITGFIGSFFSGKFLNKIKGLLFGKVGSKLLRPAIGAAKVAGRVALSAGGLAARLALQGGVALVSNPVGLGVLAAATVAYGSYKLYKYLGRNKAKNIDKIRLYQYGLGEEHNDLFYKIYALEDLFFDKIKYDTNNGASLAANDKETVEQIYELFDIKPNDNSDADKVNVLKTWLKSRFVPVYLNHINAINKVKPKEKLENVSDLDPDKQVKYINYLNVPTSIYNILKLPFKEKPNVSAFRKDVDDIVKIALDEASKNVKDDKKAEVQKTADEIKKKLEEKAKSDQNPVETKVQTTTNENKEQNTKVDSPMPKEPTGAPTAQSTGTSSAPAAPVASGPLQSSNGSMAGIALKQGVKFDQLHPKVKELFAGMAMEYNSITGKSIPVVEAFRSYEDQMRLYTDPKTKENAAPPGNSTHEKGLALDISSTVADELDKLGLMKKYGFTRPIGKEKWHIEPAGVATNPQAAKNNPNLANQLVENSPFRGGTGHAVLNPNAPKKSRDLNLQKTIFNTDSGKPVDTSSLMKASIPTQVDRPQTDVPQPVQTAQASTTTISSTAGASSQDTSSATSSSQTTNTNLPKEPSSNNTSPVTDLTKLDSVRDLDQAMKIAASLTGVDYTLLKQMAQLESSGGKNTRSKTSTAKGAFQILDGTWKELISKYGKTYNIPSSATPDHPVYGALMAALYAKENLQAIKRKIGSTSLDDSTLAYLAHHYGRGGATKIAQQFQTNPNAPITSILPDDVIRANASEYGTKGGVKSVAQYVSFIKNKMAGAANIPVPVASSQSSSTSSTISAPTPTQSQTINTTASQPAKVNVTSATAPAVSPVSSSPSTSAETSNATSNIMKIDTSAVEKILDKQYEVLVKICDAVVSLDNKNTQLSQPQNGMQYAQNEKSQVIKQSSYAVNLRTSS